MAVISLVAGFLVYASLLAIIYRQRVRKNLPWFALYVTWEALEQAALLVVWLISFQLYRALYWRLEALELALTVLAVRESFLKLFVGFTSKSGFRWSVWAVIGSVVVYSSWRAAYGPPLYANRLAAFVFGAEFLFRWCILGIAILTAGYNFLLHEPLDRRADSVVFGFGLASIGVLASILSFSLFPNGKLFLSEYAGSVGYFMAVFSWIWTFSRPVKELRFADVGIGPEQIARELSRYRRLGERLMRKRP